MTLPPVIRIFFALDLSATIKEELSHFIITLKKKSKSHAIRWTKAENLHITLHFLGEVREEHLGNMIENVRKEMKGIELGAMFSLGGLNLFPSPYRPRVIVLDIRPQAHLAMLAERVGRGIRAAHYKVENRPFRGHLTLGRIKQPKEVNLNFLTECNPPVIEKMNVTEVTLFRSEPQHDGSKYTELARFTA
jgi:2'-5' RNA ligase